MTTPPAAPWGTHRPHGLARLLIAAVTHWHLTGHSRTGRILYRLLCRLGPWYDLEDVGVKMRLHVEDIERLIRRRGQTR